MSSHNHHEWEAYADQWGIVRVHCSNCGVDILWKELQTEQEQQLAEARALLDDVVTLMMLTRTTDVLRAGTSTSLYQDIRAFLQKLSG